MERRQGMKGSGGWQEVAAGFGNALGIKRRKLCGRQGGTWMRGLS